MSVLSDLAVAIVAGVALAGGVLLLTSRHARWAAPTLANRIAPYVRDVSDPRGLTPAARLPGRGLRALVLQLLGTRASGVERRLAQAGRSHGAVTHRAHALGWAVVGLVGGALTALVLAMLAGVTAATALLPLTCAVCAVVAHDAHLTRAVRRRRRRIEEELPTVLEFLALCLAAGEGLRDALRRVGDVGTGELTAELRRAVLDSGTGSSLAEALQSVSARLGSPALARSIDHVVAAIDRGAPLAQVLQEQAGDARDEAKRALIELAGRKEIVMLLPLVFLLLPLSVLFAVFPGVVMLRLGTP